jgi:hypothetical protein
MERDEADTVAQGRDDQLRLDQRELVADALPWPGQPATSSA